MIASCDVGEKIGLPAEECERVDDILSSLGLIEYKTCRTERPASWNVGITEAGCFVVEEHLTKHWFYKISKPAWTLIIAIITLIGFPVLIEVIKKTFALSGP